MSSLKPDMFIICSRSQVKQQCQPSAQSVQCDHLVIPNLGATVHIYR